MVSADTLRDPLLEMPDGKVDYDLETFFPLFSKYIYNLVNDLESVRESTHSVLQSFEDDGVVYLELRTTPRAMPGVYTKSEYINHTLFTIAAFESSFPRISYPSSDSVSSTWITNSEVFRGPKRGMVTKMILSIDRRNTAEQASEVVDLAIKYRDRGVVGVDLCGDPSVGDIRIFDAAFKRAKNEGLGITIHFGEIDRSLLGFNPTSNTPTSGTNTSSEEVSADDVETELSTLLSWQPDRLGHAIYIPLDLKAMIKKEKIALELCVSCNVHAKMIKGTFADHHFGEWRDSGCPIILCTDDVGVFGSSLSNEYRLVAEHFNLTDVEIKTLARSGVESIFAERALSGGEHEKERLRKLMW